jgi:AcrR family transcriptional regulator
VFAQYGFADTTVNHITREAKVSRPAFYLYFASKQEVFAAVVSMVRDEFIAVHEDPEVDESDPVALARAATRAFLVANVENHGLMNVIEHQAIYDAKIAEMWAETLVRPMRRVARYVRRLSAEGVANPAASPEVIARAVLGLFGPFGANAPTDPKEFDDLVEQLAAIFLRLLGIPHEGPPGTSRSHPKGGTPRG